MTEKCHADGSPLATLRGPYGWLCSPCWERVATIVERITGRWPVVAADEADQAAKERSE